MTRSEQAARARRIKTEKHCWKLIKVSGFEYGKVRELAEWLGMQENTLRHYLNGYASPIEEKANDIIEGAKDLGCVVTKIKRIKRKSN